MDLAHFFLGYAKAHMDHPVGPPLAELGSKLGKERSCGFLRPPILQTWLVKDLHVDLQKLAPLPLLSTESQSQGIT